MRERDEFRDALRRLEAIERRLREEDRDEDDYHERERDDRERDRFYRSERQTRERSDLERDRRYRAERHDREREDERCAECEDDEREGGDEKRIVDLVVRLVTENIRHDLDERFAELRSLLREMRQPPPPPPRDPENNEPDR